MTEPLTDEERRRLVDDLRKLRPAYNLPPVVVCERAADEIERLVQEVRKLRDELDTVRRDEGVFVL